MNTHNPAVEDSIERMIARSEITALLHRYANMAVENADFPGMAALFADDGVFVVLDGTAVPASEMESIVGDNESVFLRHHLTTSHIEFTSATTATADSYYIAFTNLKKPDHWGRWLDSVRLEDDGRWVFTSKQPVVEGYDPDGWIGSILYPALRADGVTPLTDLITTPH